MRPQCPFHETSPDTESDARIVLRIGTYHRKSDGRHIQRFRCKVCGKSFSHALRSDCYRQKKRQLNDKFRKLLASGLTHRRIAELFRVSRTTVARKANFLAIRSTRNVRAEAVPSPLIEIIEFDDMESFEHTKCKPLSLLLAVESKTRKVIDVEVARMPPKGVLAAPARKKYGPRKDDRPAARAKLFKRIQNRVSPFAIFKSDENPHYPGCLKKNFPHAEHVRFRSRRACVVGQGELKKIGFDPLFSLNHTAAMFRANVSRLFRRSWNTTKNPERLAEHMMIYAEYHNEKIAQLAAHSA